MAAILGKGCQNCCNTACALPRHCCECICRAPRQLSSAICCSPLGLYATVTVLCNFPIILIGCQLPLYEHGGNKNGANLKVSWMILMTIFSVLHILAALYMILRIRNANDEAMSDLSRSIQRTRYLLCHDIGIAVYILVCIAYVIWLFLGCVWYGDNGYRIEEVDVMATCLGLGFFYLFVGPLSLCCSMCLTAHFDRNNYNNNSSYSRW